MPASCLGGAPEGLNSPKTSFHITTDLCSVALNTIVSSLLCDDLTDVCEDFKLREDGACLFQLTIASHYLAQYLARSRCSTNGRMHARVQEQIMNILTYHHAQGKTLTCTLHHQEVSNQEGLRVKSLPSGAHTVRINESIFIRTIEIQEW